MKHIALFSLLFLSFATYAQNDDPLAVLDKNVKPSLVYASATFKSTRVILGHSVETMAKNHLDFRISHHFGSLFDPNSGGGAYNFFGMDQASMRLGLEYGITDNLMIGVGRTSIDKTYDSFLKYKLLRQSSGSKNMPVSVTLLGSAALVSSKSYEFANTLESMTYCAQVLIARKITDGISIQVSPTFLHRNKVFYYDSNSANEIIEPNDVVALGIGGRFKISKRTSINAEYFYRMPLSQAGTAINTTNYHNSLSVGVDIETGGHVFQIHFTNSLGMIEKQFIAQTTETWSNGGVRWGFNLSRTFSFDKEEKKAQW